MLRHGEMKYLCQVCGQNFPFTSDLASHETIQKKKKNSSVLTLSVAKATKLRLNTIANLITGTNKSQQSHRKLSVTSDKIFSKVKCLKEHMKSHMDDLPFGCHYCGKHFKWRLGHKIHIDEEHKKESLSDEF